MLITLLRDTITGVYTPVKRSVDMRINTKELLYGALLTALALMIPLFFRGWLQVVIPPFSATLGSHVPVMLAMFVSPLTAALVGVGSTFGFLITLGPIVAARAAIHIIFPAVGSVLLRKGYKPALALLLVAPIHAVGESLVVVPFGFTAYSALVVVGLGTLLHHCADAAIALILQSALSKAGVRFAASNASAKKVA